MSDESGSAGTGDDGGFLAKVGAKVGNLLSNRHSTAKAKATTAKSSRR